jgi:hypothetical protein
LSNLFLQKKGKKIPYLDSKFQETIFARSFNAKNVDKGNTPHDILSVFGQERIGIGIKTWLSSKPSYQKVMQLKRYQDDIKSIQNEKSNDALVLEISKIKNQKLKSDYERLGLSPQNNIYHYVTRDENKFTINECAYTLIDLDNLIVEETSKSSIVWTDRHKRYKYTFGDSQIWQLFDPSKKDSLLLDRFTVKILDDPFQFLLESYDQLIEVEQYYPLIKPFPDMEKQEDIEEAYLPLYSYSRGEVKEKSGLNAWNAAPKNRESNAPRPLNEVYVPIPKEFHRRFPYFFTKENINHILDSNSTPAIRFHLELPNGKRIPALLTQSNYKSLQSGSDTEVDESGKKVGQSALGQWLLIDVLGLEERVLVTREWLQKKGTDSLHIWRKKDDYSTFYLDIAPINSFDRFMSNEVIIEDDLD